RRRRPGSLAAGVADDDFLHVLRRRFRCGARHRVRRLDRRGGGPARRAMVGGRQSASHRLPQSSCNIAAVRLRDRLTRRRAAAAPMPRRRSAIVHVWNISGLPTRQIVGRVVLAAIMAAVVLISSIAIVKALTWVNQPFAGFLVNERLVLGNIGQYHW